MDIYKDRIKPLFSESGKTDQELEKEIGLPRSIIYDWEHGRSKSYKKYCGEIAAYFRVSADYLLGTSDEKKEKTPAPKSGSGLSPAKQAIFDAVDGLTEEQCVKLLGIINEAKKLIM